MEDNIYNPEEYKMFWKYTDKFENAKKANDILKKAGLKTEFIFYFYGCATGFYRQKNNNNRSLNR